MKEVLTVIRSSLIKSISKKSLLILILIPSVGIMEQILPQSFYTKLAHLYDGALYATFEVAWTKINPRMSWARNDGAPCRT